jgi:uncharacterized membrane protein YkoI
MSTHTRSLALAGGALAAASLAACGAAAPDQVSTSPAAAHLSATSQVAEARRAVHSAAAAVRHGRPYDLERDRRGWEVDVAVPGSARPHEVQVSADGRRVVAHRRDDSGSDDAAKARQATVGFERALRVAARRGSGALTEAEIDRDRRGRLVWQATFERGATETEVSVDARSGNVTSVRHDRDEDD